MQQAAPTNYTSQQAMPDVASDFAPSSPDSSNAPADDDGSAAIVAAATQDADSASGDQSMLGLGELFGLGCGACSVAMAGLGKGAVVRAPAQKPVQNDKITLGLAQPLAQSTWYGVIGISALLVIGAAGIYAYSRVNKK